ncbi:uncharacterized protein LOC116395093 [Anarrhichthys ocellatus]|uniref:uncharacterized protein LOC116395093 n=1 Tax=Anarrhichthys ocellatus TaxID=433405 RepID=UPI0012EE2673|nr:uncharacterized protein LOC116395093 [Anarrhichthys ocellatus]
MRPDQTRPGSPQVAAWTPAFVAPVCQIMPLLAWFLWVLFRGALGGPVQLATWSELGVNPVKTNQDGAPRPLFYHLPMFLHAPGPLVPQELFQPVPHKSPFPAGLTALLLPTTEEPQSVQNTGARAVQVFCGTDKISVLVDRFQLHAWTTPALFRLGSCQASSVGPRSLYFQYRLTECGGVSKVVGGQLVYSYMLRYVPPPQGYIIRVLPLNLPIHCHYNRFHYSYQVGFKPQIQHTTFMKSIRSKLKYSLTVSNAQGQPIPPDHWFYLGETVYLVAQAKVLLSGERLYVDSCYATSSKEPTSMPKVDIIANNGCMTDSRREGSSSRFLSGGGSVVMFSVDAFLFRAVSQVLYLHCSMSIGLTPSHTSKSCNYNKTTVRWEELEATAPVCSCCDSMCSDVQDSVKNTVSSPGWLVGQKPRMAVASFQAEGGRDRVDEGKDEHHKKVQTFPWEMEIGHEEENDEAIPEETKRKHSTPVSQQVKEEKEGETDEVVVEKELATYSIMSDQLRPEEIPSTRNGSVRSLSSVNSNTKSSKDGSGTTIATRSLSIDYNASNPGSAENVPGAVIPNIKLCPKGDQMSCSEGRDATGAESFTPNNVRASSGTSSPWDSRVNGSHLKTLAGTHSDTANFKVDPLEFLNVSRLGESRLESETVDSLLWSEEVESVGKSVGTKSNELRGQVGVYFNGEGPHSYGDEEDDDDDDMLQSLQVRGLESDQSTAHPADFTDSNFKDWLVGESDSEIKEDEGSVGSEETLKDSPSHSAVVAVTNALQGSVSSQMLDRGWAKGALGWGLQTLGSMVEQPAEELRRERRDDFY